MVQQVDADGTRRRGYALCVGIGTYTHLVNRNLRYAVADATIMAERLADPQRGDFAVTVLTEPTQTTKAALEEAVEQLLSAPDLWAEDLALLYFSCHGDLNLADHTFCLLPSDASILQEDRMFDPTTLVGIYDFARWFENATAQNIIVFLDVCHSGGAGEALQHFTLKLETGPNFFFIGAARQDRAAYQSSQLEHGLFTNCLLRAFGQPPAKDGWITISQIQNFVDDEMKCFSKNDRPTQIQGSSVFVNPQLPLLRNPGYPELYPLPPLWNVPFQRNVFFTGQEELLSRLASMLQNEQKTALTQPHALSGLGGIGKTQLALEYAYRHRQNYHAVLWGRADTYEALVFAFVSIAHLLDLPEMNEQDQMIIVEAVKTWLKDRAHWLFILDNADDIALVKEFFPSAFRGHLLLTTRAQTMGKVVGSKLEVEVMRPEIGALLLLRRARMLKAEASLGEAPGGEVTRAKELAEELGGLPLALDQAGAYVEETECGLASYQRLYRTRRAELLRSRGGLVDDHPESVATTWSLSFERVEQRNPVAADLLRLCAFLAPDVIPEELLVEVLKVHRQKLGWGGWFSFSLPMSGSRQKQQPTYPAKSEGEINEAVATLRAYSLIQRNTGEKTVQVHRLVQAVVRDALPAQKQKQWMQRVVLAVSAAFPDPNFENWPACEHYLPHVLVCTGWIEQAHIETLGAVRLLNLAGYHLSNRMHNDRMRYAEAEPLYQQALAICKWRVGARHPDTAAILNNLAELYREQEKYAEAEPLYRRALAIWTQRLDPPNAAKSLNNLALLYQGWGKYAEAEPLCQRALAIRERWLGTEHPDTATALNSLANLYQYQGKYAEAEPLYQRTLTIRERLLGAEHPDTATALNNLALLYSLQGKYAEAGPLFQRALTIYERYEHPLTATSLINLAALYDKQGKYAEAEPLYQRILHMDTQKYGEEHPNVAIDLNNLVLLYHHQGKYAEAEPLCQRALAIQERLLGVKHPDTATSMNNLAELYHHQGKYAEAEPLRQRALAIRRQQLGANHTDTAQSLNNLASFYWEQGKYAEAEPLYQRALAIYEQQLDTTHPDMAASLSNLALLYHVQGKYAEAEPLYQRALAISEQQESGSEHPTTRTIRANYTSLLEDMKQDEATSQ